MEIIGGVTRLTGSGLSITEWNLVMGAIPPLNHHDWQMAFEKYQQSPQFHQVNTGMGLEAFKSIFWWEYFHRLIGRLMGITFIIPFFYFLFAGILHKQLVYKLLLLLGLGGLQGFLGWYMVKSGLIDNPHVSHFRLAIHLTMAFITFGVAFWIALDLLKPQSQSDKVPSRAVKAISRILLPVILIQVIYGAFVAGLHAGKIYNTFPKMGDEWFPFVKIAMIHIWRNFLENIVCVQFVHRCIAWLLLTLITVLWIRRKSEKINPLQKKAIHILFSTLIIQFILGVITLLYSVPIEVAVIHQAGAFALFAAAIFLSHSLNSNRASNIPKRN
jgi:cytochrome c oxidase assembly protein subunit 15